MISTIILASTTSAITIPVIIIGGLGLIFGVVLAIAARIFHVEQDPRIEQINAVLPGANCGSCGMPGCGGYADAIVHGGADINKCAPGGNSVVQKIAAIMGREANAMEKRVATIHCSTGGNHNTNWVFDHSAFTTCETAVNYSGGPNACQWGCVGYNDCLRSCPFDAISVDANNMRCIDMEKCTACGNCVRACPRNLIDLIPLKRNVYINCSSQDKGVIARKVCGSTHPCIACGACVRKCPVNAITITENLAHIDYNICINCGLCATVCPTTAIIDQIAGARKKANINQETCIGCTICAKNCPTKAISGEVKQKHTVDAMLCTGCGVCVDKCPKKSIELR